jgi:hypothetical protein
LSTLNPPDHVFAPYTHAILETLQDCAKFMRHMHRWRQARPHWELAAELILKAAKSGLRSDVDAAEGQMKRALRCDGWL